MYKPLRIQHEKTSKSNKKNPDPDYCPPVKKEYVRKRLTVEPVPGSTMRCVLHYNRLYGDPCESPIISLTNERYERLKGFIDEYYDYRELPDGTSIGTQSDEVEMFKTHYWEPTLIILDELGYHHACYRTFTNTLKYYRNRRKQAKIAKELKSPTLAPTQPIKPPNKPASKPPSQQYTFKKWTFTPGALSEEMARRNEHTPQLERLLQTLPADLLPQYDPIIEYDNTNCVVCNKFRRQLKKKGARMTEHVYGANSIKYGGRLLLSAILKDDIVMKTRIQRCVQEDVPIMRHRICEKNYTEAMGAPSQEMIDEIHFLMTTLYDDVNRPKLKPLYLAAHPNPKKPPKIDIKPPPEIGKNKSEETTMETEDNDTNFDDNDENFDDDSNFEMDETGDSMAGDSMVTEKVENCETYNKFVEIVKERIIDKGSVMRLSVLTEMYKELEKNGVVKDDGVTKDNVTKDMDCSEDELKAKLIISLPELQFDRLAMLNTELVFKQDSML